MPWLALRGANLFLGFYMQELASRTVVVKSAAITANDADTLTGLLASSSSDSKAHSSRLWEKSWGPLPAREIVVSFELPCFASLHSIELVLSESSRNPSASCKFPAQILLEAGPSLTSMTWQRELSRVAVNRLTPQTRNGTTYRLCWDRASSTAVVKFVRVHFLRPLETQGTTVPNGDANAMPTMQLAKVSIQVWFTIFFRSGFSLSFPGTIECMHPAHIRV